MGRRRGTERAPQPRCRGSSRLLPTLALLPALVAGPETGRPAPAQDVEPARAEGLARAEAGLVSELEGLVPFCTRQRLFASREALCRLILTLDAESVVAHEGLLHELDRDGVWQPPKKRSPVKDYKQSRVPEYLRRRAEAARAYVDETVRLCAPPEGRRECPTGACDAALDRALELAPDHPDLRALLGEQPDGEAPDGGVRWVLEETARGRDRRTELEALVASALGAAPAPEPLELLPNAAGTGVAFGVSIGTPLARVASTGPADEAERLARVLHATILVFREVFGVETELDPTFTVFVLTSDEDRASFVGGWPRWGPEGVEATAAFVGAGVPYTQHAARWDEDPVNRLDGAVRHTLCELFRAEFGLSTRHAWAWEGLGIYLTRALVGTRRTFYGTVEGLDPEARKLVSLLVNADEVNWMNEAYQRIMTHQGTPPAELFAKSVDELDVYDLLAVYAFGAYLLEGHPERVCGLLRAASAEDAEVAQVFDAALGRPLEGTWDRFGRWMGERR